jgi:hypothetical protein
LWSLSENCAQISEIKIKKFTRLKCATKSLIKNNKLCKKIKCERIKGIRVLFYQKVMKSGLLLKIYLKKIALK